MVGGARGCHTHGHVVRDHGYFRLEVHTPLFVRDADRIARTEKVVRCTLIHERITRKVWRHLGAARLAGTLDVR